ncbi:hypothetical protein QCA50_000447 [Cerrena zonata]|uniref:Uncharacterized protein n=1 Tax=Cerrena zonata TaxID=2478898 RepID=A0AAW0GWR1_9APHY
MADDILGYSVIGTDGEANKFSVVSAFYNREECIAEAVASITERLWCASELDVCVDMHGIQEEYVIPQKSDFAAQMIPVYESCSIPLTAAGQTPLHLDYIPWIRYMVGVDDAVQKLAPASEQSGRRTRNSRRAVEQRYLGHLKERELETLSRTAFATVDR